MAKEDLKASFEQVLEKFDKANKTAVRNALTILFPNHKGEFGGFSSSSSNTPLFGARLANKEYSENYFSLSLKNHLIPKFLLDLISKGDTFEDGIDQVLLYINKNDLPQENKKRALSILTRAIYEFIDSTEMITPHSVVKIIRESARILELSSNADRKFFELSALDRLRGALVRAIQKMKDDERETALNASVNGSQDLTLICEVFRSFVGDKISEGAKGLFSETAVPSELQSVREALYEKALNKLNQQDFWEQIDPAEVLWFIWGGGFGDHLKHVLSNFLQKDHVRSSGLLKTMPRLVLSTAGNYFAVNATWWQIIDRELATETAKSLSLSGTAREVAISHDFLEAIKHADF